MEKGFYFYANPFRPRSIEAARLIFAYFKAQGIPVFSESWLAEKGVGSAAELEEAAPKIRAVAALGGDGTLLRIAPRAAKLHLPLLGIQAGNVGFLMQGNADDPGSIFRILTKDSYPLSCHRLLQAEVNGESYFVLNDVSLTRGEHPGVMETSVYADGEWVFTAHGDGVVVSTPLGATAYTLAAGGPVLRPDLNCTLITPLCARELLLRPVVMPQSAKILVRVQGSQRRRYQLSLDGQILLPVTDQTDIRITPAQEQVMLIQTEAAGFFETLRMKQRQWNQSSEKEQE